MAQVQYKLFAYVYNNGLAAYAWTELTTTAGHSRLVAFESMGITSEDSLGLYNQYAELGDIRVWDQDNYWGSLASASLGLINTSDPVWQDYRYRPIKVQVLDESSNVKMSMVACIDDILPQEGSPVATIKTIGLARRAAEAMADGTTIAGNTIYGAWGSATSPTLYAARTETASSSSISRTWFTNRRIADILSKTCYALEEDRLGTPSITVPTVSRSTRAVSCRNAISLYETERIYDWCSDGTDLWIVAGRRLYKYDVSEDSYDDVYTDTDEDAALFRIFYNTNGNLYIIRKIGAVISVLEYDISEDSVTGTQTLTDFSHSASHNCHWPFRGTVLFIQMASGGVLFYATDRGIYAYTCDKIGTTWTEIDNDPLPTDFYDAYVVPHGVFRYWFDGDEKYYLYYSAMGDADDAYEHCWLQKLTWDVTVPGFTAQVNRWKSSAGDDHRYVIDIGFTTGHEIVSLVKFGYSPGHVIDWSDWSNPVLVQVDIADASPVTWDGTLETGDLYGVQPGVFASLETAPDGKVYYIRNRNNMLAAVYESSGTPTVQEQNILADGNAFGFPCFTQGNNGIWTGGVIDGTGCRMVLDGGTSATFKIYMIARPNDIMYQFAKSHSGFLELCDFDGMSVADIRTALARMVRGRWYYDKDGVFHFEQIPVANGTSAKDYAEGEVFSLGKDGSGRDKIINRMSYTPYEIQKDPPEIRAFRSELSTTSTWKPTAPKCTSSPTAFKYWRLLITAAAEYRLDYLDSGVWTNLGTGYSTANVNLAAGEFIINPDMFVGTPVIGDAVFWWVIPAKWEYKKLTEFDVVEVTDATSVASYGVQQTSVDEKFFHRMWAEQILTDWLALTKDPKSLYSVGVPYEGMETTLVPWGEISLTSAKHNLTSATHFRIKSLSLSGDSARIKSSIGLVQI